MDSWFAQISILLNICTLCNEINPSKTGGSVKTKQSPQLGQQFVVPDTSTLKLFIAQMWDQLFQYKCYIFKCNIHEQNWHYKKCIHTNFIAVNKYSKLMKIDCTFCKFTMFSLIKAMPALLLNLYLPFSSSLIVPILQNVKSNFLDNNCNHT